MKSRYCEDNYNLFMAVSCFSKQSILDAWQGSEYASSSEYSRVLNSSWFWIYTWLYLEYISQCARVLDTPEFWICFWIWICHDSQYARVIHSSEYTSTIWRCLIMSEYVWICLNIPKYALMWLSLPEWLLFYIFPFHHLFYNPFSISNTWLLI